MTRPSSIQPKAEVELSAPIAIPQPPTFGPLGNLPLLDSRRPVQSMMKLAQRYGPIFRLVLPGRATLALSSHALVADACDEARFDKFVWMPLQRVRTFTGDGLFTSATVEPNWTKAHHILLPSFSQRAMQGYHEMMLDLAVQLVQKWSRLNPDESVNVPADMTRLTLDTIGLCGFNYRFNSFYREQPHPFIVSMVRALDTAMGQVQRLGVQNRLMLRTRRQLAQDIKAMNALVDQIIAERRASGDTSQDDLLGHMLYSRDPETGEMLDDENIRYQIITFLIAGHETTSGLLSFALYYLLKHPAVLHKAQQEVDRVLTDPLPSYRQVRDLQYIRMILNESLRLWPTAPAFALFARQDTLLANTYPLSQGQIVTVLIPQLHRDRAVWGNDVEVFRPERFADPSAIPLHAFKPFGNGQRACIGQQFAMQEATLVLGMLLKHFEIIDDSNYQLKIKETLTLKPEDFTMRIRRRGAPWALNFRTASAATPLPSRPAAASESAIQTHNTPLLLLYGSNLGTAEGIAREMANHASAQGFRCKIAPLDSAVDKLPTDGAVLIVTSSYNGTPPDNARNFIHWLESADSDALRGVRYAVFGCGDHNWASTYQRIPRLIDSRLAAKGAARMLPIGEGDASDDFEAHFDSWRTQFWPILLQTFDIQSDQSFAAEADPLTVRFVSSTAHSPLAQTYGATLATIVENRELQAVESGRSTRHIEIALPAGLSYREGDHLGVLPRNAPELVERVLQRFQLQGDEQIVLSGSSRNTTHLLLEQPVRVRDLLTQSVELQESATRAQLRALAAYNPCPPHKRELEQLTSDETYKRQVLHPRLSMLDLLEQYRSCDLPFERFLTLLPPLKPRYYSISSSPRQQPGQASITVAVLDEPAWSGRGQYRGVASHYLARQDTKSQILIFIRTPLSGFQLPQDPATPIIMVGPGTGVAPFRGFIQARRVLQGAGQLLGEAHLYFGCRNPALDYLYRDEFEQAERDGLVTLHTAGSRVPGKAKTYVQHLMQQDSAWLIPLLDNGARLYVCGDGSRMAPDVDATLIRAYANAHGVLERAAYEWLEELQQTGRYAKDVWAGA